MQKTHDFKFNLPAYSDPVDVEDFNDNFTVIDDALMAGLCKKEYTGNNMGSSDPSSRKYAWAPWFEIQNDNEFEVTVTDRNLDPSLPAATITIAAGQSFRKYINGTYYLNFYVQDQHDVTFKWFTDAETYINESGGGGGGTGTVTSVSVQGGSGSHLTASGNPVETSGTITINVDEGYSIPQTSKQTAWDSKAADLKAEIDSSTYVMTLQLKDSAGNLIGSEKTIDLPLETMVVDGEYDPLTKKIKLELKNGNYVEFSVADLVSGLQTKLNDTTNKLNPTYIDWSTNYRSVSDTEKNTWNSKGTYSKPTDGIPKTDLASTVQASLDLADSALQSETDPTVPSWAKQTNKPAYTSDEISDANQTNKFATAAQLTQIATNQTNILYSLQNGAKNLFRWDKWVNDCTVVGGTKSIGSSGTITLTASSTNCYTEYEGSAYPDVEIAVKENEQYVMTWEYGRSAGSNRGTVYVVFVGSTGAASASASAEVKKIEFTTPTGTTGLRVYIKQTTNGLSEYFNNFMICSKVIWDTVGHNYLPTSVPNYVLTQLEAEDRAALVEVIDRVGGTKNKLDITGWYVSNARGITFAESSQGKITASGNNDGTGTSTALLAKLSAAQMQLLKGCILSGGVNSNIKINLQRNASPWNTIVSTGDTGASDPIPDINYECTVNIIISTNTQLSSPVTLKPMICTLPEWKISQDYVPNTDIEDITSTIEASEGFTLSSLTHVFKRGNHVFGDIVVIKSNGTFNSQLEKVAKQPVSSAPKYQYGGTTIMHVSEWGSKAVGYSYLAPSNASSVSTRGDISVKCDVDSTCNVAHIYVDYIC